MKIARVPTKKRNIITLLILIIGLPLVVYASYQVVQLISNASADNQPRNVTISNVTTVSATITWTTDSKTTGTATIKESGAELSPVLDTRGNTKRYTHFIEFTDLEPSTTYEFSINSGGTSYTSSGGSSFTFETAPITADTPTPNPVYGSVSGVSTDDVLVFAMLKDKTSYAVSATMPSGGNWIMDLSTFRKISDGSLIISDTNTNLVLIAVTGTNQGGVLSGSYSTLFDSNGKLNTTHNFSMGENTTLYSYFPESSSQDSTEEDETPVVEEPEEGEPKEEIPVEEPEQETDGRTFRIVKDLQWEDMVVSGVTNWPSGEDTVKITNLTDTGFTVVWVSAEKEEGSIKYGTSASELTSTASDERDSVTNKGKYYVHSVSLTRLQPETKYYFTVSSGDSTYDGFNATTFDTLSTPPSYVSITGVVDNMPETGEGVLIAYIKDGDSTGTTGNSMPISTVIDEDGKWILSVADSRSSDGSEYYEYTSSDTIYFSVVSTIPAVSPVSASMNGITSKDVDVSLEYSTSTTVTKLSDYGVI